MNAVSLDRQDRHAMKADRIRAILGAGAEHASGGPPEVSSRVDCQHVPARAIEPGEDQDVVADLETLEPLADGGVDHHPRVGRTFVPLPRRALGRQQGGLHPTDGFQDHWTVDGEPPCRSGPRL